MHKEDRDVEFKWREKLYTANWVADAYTCTSVRENMLVYTKEELLRAREVYELVRSTGYPSLNDAFTHGWQYTWNATTYSSRPGTCVQGIRSIPGVRRWTTYEEESQ